MSVLTHPRSQARPEAASVDGNVRKRRSPTGESQAIRWARRISLTVIGLFALLPIYWLIVTSLRETQTVFEFPPQLLPVDITFEHFQTIFGNGDLLRFLLNSILVSVITAFGSVFIGMYCAYSFSKFRYRGRRSLMFLILCSQLFPHVLLLITIYGLFSALGLLNSYPALVLAFTTFTLPLCIWMLKGTFDNIPDELIEAAKIDGASQFVIIHKILFPLAAPGLIAAGLFAFVRGWNDFVFALTLSGDATRTLPPGLVTTYLNEFSNRWPELMAASLVAALPVLVIFLALQKYFVAGLGAGAVKG